jgi:PAS domain S-box-containing protein
MHSQTKVSTNSLDTDQIIDQQTNDGRFAGLMLSVIAILCVYSPLYASYGAHVISLSLLVGGVLLTPLAYQLNKRGFRNASRIIFVLSCNAYVFQFALGLGHQADAENYCIPLMMLSLMLFDISQRSHIIATCTLAFSNWILITWNDVLVLPQNLVPESLPVHYIAKLNFMGAFVITGIFFMIFVKSTNLHRLASLKASEDANASSQKMLRIKTESERKLKMIVESMQEGLVIVGSAGEVLEVNKVARDMAGELEAGEKNHEIDDYIQKFFWPDGREMLPQELPASQVLINGQPISGQVVAFDQRNGDRRWMRVSAALFFDSSESDEPERKVLSTFTDITDLVLAQRELEEFFNLNSDFMAVADVSHHFRRVNPSLMRSLGYDQNFFNQNSTLSIMHKDDIPTVKGAIENIKRGAENQIFEIRMATKSGDYRLVSWALNGNPETSTIYATGRDITAERENQDVAKKINEENRALASLLEETQRVAKIGSWAYDMVNNTLAWSSQLFEIFSLPSENGAPDTEKFMSLIHPEDRERWLKDVVSNGKDEQVHKIRYRCIRDSKVIWIESISQGIRAANGEIGKVSGTIQDVTEQVETDQKHIFVLDALGIGIWENNFEDMSVRWDNRMYAMYGIRADEFKDATEAWQAVTTEETQAEVVKSFNESISRGKEIDMTFEVRMRNGETKTMWSRGTVIRDSQGNPKRMMGINWDKSKEVELEKSLLVERAKMINSSKMATLGEMSAGIAHEINNPLAIIVGKTDKLERLAARPGMTIETLLPEFADIKKTAHRIASLIKGLRTFSRNSEGDPFQSASVDALIVDTLALCKERFKSGSVNLIVPEESHLEIDVRSTQISQILLNLLNNAFDAVCGSKDAWIKLEIQAIDARFVQFRVSDSGLGIPAHIADKIMNPFFTTKDIGKGTGLGLSISQGMAHDHGGTLKLDAQAPNTCFVLELPIHQASEKAA